MNTLQCTCVSGEGCDENGDPGCRYCQIIDPELPCPTEYDDVQAPVDPTGVDCWETSE